jgi:hypothetical protein
MNTGRETMKLTWSSRLVTAPAAWFLSSMITVPALALQTSPPTATPTPAAPSKPDTRVVAVVPAFNVASFDDRTSLTPREKFHIVWRTTLDPFSLIAPAVKSVIYNAAGLNSGFGSGASGFFKRYGAAIADGASGRFFRTYAYPVLLHEDPRYFRLGSGTKKTRTWYSINRVFVTRTDAGNSRFNWSKMLGSFTSSGLSNLYYPKENRGGGFTFIGVGFSYLGEASMNLVKEFWPDISAKRKARKSKSQPSPSSGEGR